jgi:hypothetical protein
LLIGDRAIVHEQFTLFGNGNDEPSICRSLAIAAFAKLTGIWPAVTKVAVVNAMTSSPA